MQVRVFVCLAILIALVGTAGAQTFYLNSTNSDLSGGADWSKTLRGETTAVSTIAATILRSSTRTQFAWTNSTTPNNNNWETGAFTVKVNVTALGSTSYLWLNVQVDHIYANGTVIESSDASSEQKMTGTGVKTFSIASKDWTAGATTDRLRLGYLMRNSRSNADYAMTISQGDVNSYVDGSVAVYKTPVASFTKDKTSGGYPLTVTFTDTSTNTPTSWFWVFGDGSTTNNTVQSPIHTFTSAGTYNVNLTATNNGGSSTTATQQITVTDTTPPVASFTTSKNFIRIPNTVTVTDTSTNTPTSWQWSWGDGTANSTTQNPTHQYLKRGKFDIYLTATNAGGSGSTANPTSVKVVGYENYY
jgi:PKD repeat protein